VLYLDTMEPGTVCIANIGPRQRQKRLVIGIVSLAVSAGIAATLVWRGVAVGWRVALFLPLMSAAVGFFQWREKT
jgi:hypothetical protein